MGKVLAVLLVACTVAAGFGVWYLQVYAFYDELEPQVGYQVAHPDGTARLSIADFRGIDSDSSPLRYRACFTITGEQPTFVDYLDATPLIAPGWFDCFDAVAIGADLESGAARAVLVEANTLYGIDRVMALYPDGQAFVWPQFNACGNAFYEDDPLPVDCPPPPAN